MNNNASFIFALFLVIGDFLALMAAFAAAYILRVKVPNLEVQPLVNPIPALTYIKAFFFVLPLWILVHGSIGLYSQSVYEKRYSELGRLMVGSFVGILVVIGYEFVSEEVIFPARLVPVYGLALGFSFLFIFRSFARLLRRTLFKYKIGVSNVLVIGDTDASESIVRALDNYRRSGQDVLGVVGREVGSVNYYESFEEALSRLRRPVHSIIQTELYRDQDKNNEILRYARQNHVSYRFVPGNSDLFVGNIQVELFAGLPVVAVHQTALIGWGRIVKRLFDLVVAGLMITILSPVFLIIMLLEKIFDPKGDVFFRQTRLTRFNREFQVFKFRTHKSGISGLSYKEAFARVGRPELYEQYKANGYVIEKDPRVSALGRFLRKTSLDELPQLFNVLKGDISLVGPRALISEELNAYEKKHSILSVKSGLTGLAQISGRKDISFEERRSLDVYYVQNWSFWWDVIILFKTLKVVVFGSGAK